MPKATQLVSGGTGIHKDREIAALEQSGFMGHKDTGFREKARSLAYQVLYPVASEES